MEPSDGSPDVVTIGHSDRDFAEFSEFLTDHGVARLIDVRRYPNSRRHPQFNEGNLAESLDEEDIDYEHWPEIGGYRDPAQESSNTALEEGFRGVADHLNTDSGQRTLDELETITEAMSDGDRLALMCAEKEPQRCHRKLIGDHLTVRGIRIRHLIEEDEERDHELHPSARVSDRRVTYPGLL